MLVAIGLTKAYSKAQAKVARLCFKATALQLTTFGKALLSLLASGNAPRVICYNTRTYGLRFVFHLDFETKNVADVQQLGLKGLISLTNLVGCAQ